MGVVGEQDQIQSAGSFTGITMPISPASPWDERYVYLPTFTVVDFYGKFVGKYTYHTWILWDHLWLVTLVRDHLKRNLGLKAVTRQRVIFR